MSKTYDVVRFFQDGGQRVILKGITLEEAQAHCRNPETSSRTATCARSRKVTEAHGEWFDGYREH